MGDFKSKVWITTHKEPLLFALITLIFLGPVFGSQWLLTLDGPSHLYNAGVIKELIFGSKDSLINTHLALTPVPVPNWFGHFLLVIFSTVLSVAASMKLLHALYVLGLI